MLRQKHCLRPVHGVIGSCAVLLCLLAADGCAQGGADDMAGPWGEGSGGKADATTDAPSGLSPNDAFPVDVDPPVADDDGASLESSQGTATDDSASSEDDGFNGDGATFPEDGSGNVAGDGPALAEASTGADDATADASIVMDAGAVVDVGSNRPDASGYDAQVESSAASDSGAMADTSNDANATCFAAYRNAACLTYVKGQQVSNAGHNWRCADLNCENCATYPNCEPGAPVTPACPWGAVWTDEGACQ